METYHSIPNLISYCENIPDENLWRWNSICWFSRLVISKHKPIEKFHVETIAEKAPTDTLSTVTFVPTSEKWCIGESAW